ncbi:MAG: acylphosphatase [Flavobacteriales bacterium]|nr:acylphosphatase [Flavobacteriales bacterium]
MQHPRITHRRIRATGRVQGVWYRKSASEEALRLNLAGTVKNLPDGSVLIHVQGPAEQVDQFLHWCRKGPPQAEVANVEMEELPLVEYDGFTIER